MTDVGAPLELGDGRPQGRVLHAMRRARGTGEPKANSAARPTKNGAARSHHQSPTSRASPITIREGDAEQREREAEQEPAAEHGVQVALVAHAVPPVPPEPDHDERHLGHPQEGEAEHAEQHPGPERACRRLPHEPGTPPRVDREHGDLDDETGHAEPGCEMVVGARPPEHRRPGPWPPCRRAAGAATTGTFDCQRNHAATAHTPASTATAAAPAPRRLTLAGSGCGVGVGVGGVCALERARVRIRVGEQVQVRVDLAAVPKRVGREVAQTLRSLGGCERHEPRQDGRRDEGDPERRLDGERGDREQQPEQRLPAVLARGLREHEVERVDLGRPREPRERVRGEAPEGVDVEGVPHEARQEPVQRLSGPPADERHEPLEDPGEHGGHGPEESHTRCGITSGRRKSTVTRERRRSVESPTTCTG